MENGQAGDDRLAPISEVPAPCDVTRTTKKEEEVTQVESKTNTVQIQAETSNLTTSTLTTEPLLTNTEEEHFPDAIEGNYLPQEQTTHCKAGISEVTEKETDLLNLEPVHAAEESNSQENTLPDPNQQTNSFEQNIGTEITPNIILEENSEYPEANLSLNTNPHDDPNLNETANETSKDKETSGKGYRETLEKHHRQTLKKLSEEALIKYQQKVSEQEKDLGLEQEQQINTEAYETIEGKESGVQNSNEDTQKERVQTATENGIIAEEVKEQQVQLPLSEEQSNVEQPFEEQTLEEQPEQQPTEQQPTEQQLTEQQPTEQQPTEQQPTEQQPLVLEPTEQQLLVHQPTEQQPTEQQQTEQQPINQQPSEQQPTIEQPAKEEPLTELSPEGLLSVEPSENNTSEDPQLVGKQLEEHPSVELQPSEVLQISQSIDSCSETAVGKPPVSDTVNDEKVPQTTEINKMANVNSQNNRKEVRSAEIQEGSIKNQLHEIINEIDIEVSRDEEEGVRSHTWQPKGHYEIRRTPIKYEEIVPVEIPDIQFTERKIAAAKPAPEVKKPQKQKQEISLEPLKILRHTIENGEPVSPLEIPVGIPLLAKILPKEENGEEEPREKIPLERLFTPATDADEIAPQKKKRAFASSSFYGPDHPTIDDQLELAHKISVSLIDENNKSSKGQNMYMKRKNRSSKWIHQAAQYEMDEIEEEKPQAVEKPPLKLVLNPKGMQDYNAVQRHYEELLSSSESVQQITRMELGMEIASNLESPTGKGAALFAKRKKRMDKFIVDEMSVQQQQKQQTPPVQEDIKSLQKTEVRSTTQKSFSAQQTSATMKNGPASLLAPPVVQPGNLKLPDLTTILTQPKPPEKKTSAPSPAYSSGRSMVKTKPISSSRSRSADSKPSLLAKSASTATFSAFNTPSSQKTKVGELKRTASGSSFNAFSTKSSTAFMQNLDEDPLANLRPGSPPVVLVPDGKGGFMEKRENVQSSNPVIATTNEATTNNEGGAIYTAEVKVVQKKSLPTTPNVELPVAAPANYSFLDQLSTTSEEEKRKSFNFAAKGWGTYNNFYTPLHLGVL